MGLALAIYCWNRFNVKSVYETSLPAHYFKAAPNTIKNIQHSAESTDKSNSIHFDLNKVSLFRQMHSYITLDLKIN